MIRRHPISTRNDTRFPCATLFRSHIDRCAVVDPAAHLGRGFVQHMLHVAALRLVAREHQVQALHPSGLPPALEFVDVEVVVRSEEHTSELQSLMRISYAVFCLNTTIVSS